MFECDEDFCRARRYKEICEQKAQEKRRQEAHAAEAAIQAKTEAALDEIALAFKVQDPKSSLEKEHHPELNEYEASHTGFFGQSRFHKPKSWNSAKPKHWTDGEPSNPTWLDSVGYVPHEPFFRVLLMANHLEQMLADPLAAVAERCDFLRSTVRAAKVYAAAIWAMKPYLYHDADVFKQKLNADEKRLLNVVDLYQHCCIYEVEHSTELVKYCRAVIAAARAEPIKVEPLQYRVPDPRLFVRIVQLCRRVDFLYKARCFLVLSTYAELGQGARHGGYGYFPLIGEFYNLEAEHHGRNVAAQHLVPIKIAAKHQEFDGRFNKVGFERERPMWLW